MQSIAGCHFLIVNHNRGSRLRMPLVRLMLLYGLVGSDLKLIMFWRIA